MSGINSLSESIGGTKCWRRIGAVGKPIGKLFGTAGTILMAADAVKTGTRTIIGYFLDSLKREAHDTFTQR